MQKDEVAKEVEKLTETKEKGKPPSSKNVKGAHDLLGKVLWYHIAENFHQGKTAKASRNNLGSALCTCSEILTHCNSEL